jgi:hypothetical protein
MNAVSHYAAKEMLRLVTDSIEAVAPNLGVMTAESRLTGSGAVLDSIGFVTLLVSIEQNLNGRVDLAASFMAQGNPDSSENPFRTVGSLADHLQALLSSKAKK